MKAKLDVRGLANALTRRGSKLGPPASDAEIARLKAIAAGLIAEEYLDVYRQFNGFEAPDRESMISLWPIDRILAESEFTEERRLIAPGRIGDLLLDSDFLVSDLADANSPVYLLFEKRRIADSMLDFLAGLSEGRFDFLSVKN